MSTESLVARPLAPEDRGAWESLADRHGCIFDSLRWTSLFGPSLIRVGIYDPSGGLRGGFHVFSQRKCGFRMLRNPPYTPQIGPFFELRASNPAARTDEQRAVVDAMARYLHSSGAVVVSLGLSLGVTDCLPFRWRGWKVVPHYTYRIDLTQNEDALLTGMSPRERKSLRKAERDGVCVVDASGTEELRSLVLKTYARQKKALPRGDAMDAILETCPPGKGSFCCIARQDGIPIAGRYAVHDSRTAYALISGYDSERSHHGAGALTIWHAILKAKDMGLEVFDFEGSVIPPIEQFFRGFGGVLTPVFSVYRAWLPVEMGLKFIRRETF